nr:alpha/beta fold hydrolase [Kibdelosporangium sp. MJ126-NF4]CEL17446.1 possible lipase [Kibdelosporangium sp. MJ126-NF4]CTQ91327.1 possible lipase [Kibdelosporangium sp. MJ126-NF4]
MSRVTLALSGLLLASGLLATAAPAAAGATSEPSTATFDGPPGANNWSCRPSSAHPDPVVLVHGASLNKTLGWLTLSPQLAGRGYCVFSLTYGVPPGTPFPLDQIGGRNRMEDSAVELGHFIDRVLAATGAAKVDIVGHSEGSLMPNYYAKFLGGAAKINRYVAMTPLWRGSTVYGVDKLVRMIRLLGLGGLIDVPANLVFASAPQFLASSDFIAKMNEGGVAVPGITYTNILTRFDEAVVPYTSGLMDAPNATNVVVQDLCPFDFSEHGLLAYDPVNAQVVLNALDPAHATPVRC